MPEGVPESGRLSAKDSPSAGHSPHFCSASTSESKKTPSPFEQGGGSALYWKACAAVTTHKSPLGSERRDERSVTSRGLPCCLISVRRRSGLVISVSSVQSRVSYPFLYWRRAASGRATAPPPTGGDLTASQSPLMFLVRFCAGKGNPTSIPTVWNSDPFFL